MRFIMSLALAGLAGTALAGDRDWPQWRGPAGTGVAADANPPTEWSADKNIRWKVEVPGEGLAAPIVWGQRVFLLTAVPEGEGRGPEQVHRFTVLALERGSGKLVWERVVCAERPHAGTHRDGSQAPSSPLTDGEHVYAYFGSRGLYCLTMDGELVWSKRFGEMTTRNDFGEGSSPALADDTIVIVWDHEGEDFIAALDKRTGEEKWRQARDEPTNWSTPVVVEAGGRKQVIVSATNFVKGYDLETGEEQWRCSGMTRNTIPTPVVRGDMVYVMSGFRGNALLAIRYAGARGDITDTPYVTWKYDGKDTPYVPSPLLYEDLLYFLDNNRAILSCVDVKDGSVVYDKQRLEGMDGVYASPVGAAGRVYIAGRGGKVAVLKHGRSFELLAMNELDDRFNASPAIVDGELFLRGDRHLYCIAGE